MLRFYTTDKIATVLYSIFLAVLTVASYSPSLYSSELLGATTKLKESVEKIAQSLDGFDKQVDEICEVIDVIFDFVDKASAPGKAPGPVVAAFFHLIEAEADKRSSNDEAARLKKVEQISKFLLENTNLSPERANARGVTALHYAALKGRDELFEFFINCGVSPMIKDSEGRTPLHYAVQSNTVKGVKYLVDTCRVPINEPSNKGYTPLHMAALSGNIDIIQYLIEKGAQINGFKKLSPVHCAAMKGRETALTCLIDCGARLDEKDQYGKQLIHYAAKKGHENLLKLLIATYAEDPNKRANKGLTPLHYAVGGRRKKAIEKLIELKCEKNAQDSDGKTPLHYATLYRFDDMIKVLLEHEVSIMIKDSCGLTPLHYAVLKRHIPSIEKLLEAQGNSSFSTCNLGLTPLDYATLDGQNYIIRLFWPAKKDDNENNNNESSLVDFIEKSKVAVKDKKTSAFLRQVVNNGNVLLIAPLLKLGVNPNEQDQNGETCLHCAVKKNNKEAVEELLAFDIELDVADNSGKTPLHYAVLNSAVMVKALLDKGAFSDGKDENGLTPLLLVCKENVQDGVAKDEIVSLLIDHGADVTEKDKEGNTPLHWATKNGCDEVVKKLLEHEADKDLYNKRLETSEFLLRSLKGVKRDKLAKALKRGKKAGCCSRSGKLVSAYAGWLYSHVCKRLGII